jgi:REP element-mobilizing transposase RayT
MVLASIKMARQVALEFPEREERRTWGGRRAGAGRKRIGRGVEPHVVRPFLTPRHPVHVVLRVTPDVGRLRRRRAYEAFRRALITSLGRSDFRVVHISIQRHHVHLLVEADDRLALSRGVRALSISAAHQLNDAVTIERRLPRPRRGRVFTDRYHATPIKTPTQARSALAYVLNNWRHHREDVSGALRRAKVDPYSSAVWFPGWAGRETQPFAWPRGYDPLPVSYPTRWLLTIGWRRGGPPVAMHDVPGGTGASTPATCRTSR